MTDPVVSRGAVEFDPFSEDFFNAPFKTYRRLRDEAPVYYNEKYGVGRGHATRTASPR